MHISCNYTKSTSIENAFYNLIDYFTFYFLVQFDVELNQTLKKKTTITRDQVYSTHQQYNLMFHYLPRNN